MHPFIENEPDDVNFVVRSTTSFDPWAHILSLVHSRLIATRYAALVSAKRIHWRHTDLRVHPFVWCWSLPGAFNSLLWGCLGLDDSQKFTAQSHWDGSPMVCIKLASASGDYNANATPIDRLSIDRLIDQSITINQISCQWNQVNTFKPFLSCFIALMFIFTDSINSLTSLS